MDKSGIEIRLRDEAATRRLGALLGRLFPDGGIIALTGDLGAGKTTLVKGLAADLGVTEVVTSPTFTMLNEYHSGSMLLFHFDLYRMHEDGASSPPAGQDLLLAELSEIAQTGGIIIIEWAECLADKLPAGRLLVKLDYADDGGRTAMIYGSEELSVETIAGKLSDLINP